MFEKIVDIFKVFFEKYFISSLVAIIPTSVIFYYTPVDNSIFIKFGKSLYLLVVYVFVFLIITFIVYLYKNLCKKIKKWTEKRYYQKEQEKYKKEEEQESINQYLDRLDSLKPNFFELIEYLLEHDNSALTVYGMSLLNEFELYGFFDSKEIVLKEDIISIDPFLLDKEVKFKKGSHVSQFKLKEDVYHDLKIIKKRLGKISRF